jgi:MFS transporter, DHA1 family, multidrug resistance protein
LTEPATRRTPPPARRPSASPINWRRTLIAATITIFVSGFSFTFVTPFLPLFLARDLHVTDPGQLAIWSGIASSGSGLATGAVAPLWGRLADRYGRRRMVLRATVAAGLMTIVLSLCQTPLQVAVARLLMGLGSGVTTASNALVASQAPRARVAWALGLMSSALAIGAAIGPFSGGVLASFLPVRIVILGTGMLLLVCALPVLLLAREDVQKTARRGPPPLLDALRRSGPGTARAVFALVTGQALLQIAYYGAQPLVALRILSLHPDRAALLTGLTFGLAGTLTGVAGLLYSRPASRTGYRRLGIFAALLLAAAMLGTAFSQSLWMLVPSLGAAGLFYGAANPTLSSMLGLESPREVQATVFGWNGSAFSFGAGLGPIAGGFVGAGLGIQAGLWVAVAAAVALALVLLVRGREPRVAPA